MPDDTEGLDPAVAAARAGRVLADRGLIVTVVVGVLLSIGAFLLVRDNARRERLAALDGLAESRAAAIEHALDGAIDQVRATAVYLGTTIALEGARFGGFRPEFRTYAAELARTSPHLVVVSLVARVPGPNRAGFIADARPTDGSAFEITELAPDGTVVPAAEREVYFPLTIVAPIPPQPLRGYDLGRDPARRARLERALVTDEVVVEPSDRALPIDPALGTLAVLVPYREAAGVASDRSGFALALMDMRRLLGDALAVLPEAPLQVEVLEDESGERLFSQDGDEEPRAVADPRWARTSAVDVEGHRMRVVTRALPSFQRPADRATQWLVLAAGLLITTLLAGYLANKRRREGALAEVARQRREMADQLKAVFDSTLDAIISADDHGVISEWNPAAERLFGWRAGDVIGRTLADTVIPPEDREGHLAALRALRDTGRSPLIGTAFEYAMQRRDGITLPVELIMTPTPVAGRSRITAFIRDISHRKEAEAAMMRAHDELEDRVRERTAELQAATERLTESEQRLRLLFDDAGDAVYVTDEQGRIRDANRRASAMLGYTYDELLLLAIPDIETKADPRRPVGPRQAALPLGEVMTFQGEQRRKDGTTFPVEARVGPIESEGERLYVALVRDVTERKAMEEALAEARDRAIEASRLKSDFLANTSHEIRTPLNGILGMTGLLLESELTPAQREDLETVRQSAQHLLAIINDILDLARIEAGRFHLDQTPFDLEEVLHGVAALLSAAAEQKGIEFILRIDPQAPRMLVGDAARLRQVLVNLAGNAVKFTDRGHVLLEAEAVGLENGSATLRLAVTDTGIGIADTDLERVFEKFTQADSSAQRRHGGAGLGLTITRQIVEAMGGTVSAKSTLGRGSTFAVTATLPIAGDSRRPALPRELAGVRTLIVDDNPVNRRVLKEQITSWRMRATSVASPEEALIELGGAGGSGDPYRIALLDYQMAGMDGLDLARRIRERPGVEPPIVLLLSSMGRHFDASVVRSAGITRWLTKPVSPSELLDALTAAWDGESREAARGAAPGERPAEPAELRVLLAEDSPVNQKVATRMLAGLGCEVDVATNGVQAVEMAARDEYDLIFMDCQMPEMDGYEATRRIRRREGGDRHTPIVALTAHAMAGDRERCLEAGMDDYLSKPVPREDLEVILRRYAGSGTARPDAGSKTMAATGGRVDRAMLLRAVSEDRDTLEELAGLFRDQSREQLGELKSALEQEDAGAIRRLGHALKGGLATLYAREAAKLAGEVEEAGRTGDPDAARRALPRLEEHVLALPDELTALARSLKDGESA